MRFGIGFSLIEVLAVVAIIMLLVTLYWGGTGSDSRRRQVRKDCQNQLQRLYMSLIIYANEHADRFPVVTNAHTSAEALALLVPRYTVDTTLFFCPGTQTAPAPGDKPLGQQRISYAYYMGRRSADAQGVLMSDEQVSSSSKSPGEAAFSSTGKAPGNNHGKIGGNFLFCDGRAESSPPRVPFSLGLTPGLVLLNPDSK
jgi:prepilin-type processing-associated H-X9-DG protein